MAAELRDLSSHDEGKEHRLFFGRASSPALADGRCIEAYVAAETRVGRPSKSETVASLPPIRDKSREKAAAATGASARKQLQRKLNLRHRHMTAGQKAFCALAILEYEEGEARRRMEAGRPKEGSANLHQDTGKASEKAAAATGGSDSKSMRAPLNAPQRESWRQRDNPV